MKFNDKHKAFVVKSLKDESYKENPHATYPQTQNSRTQYSKPSPPPNHNPVTRSEHQHPPISLSFVAQSVRLCRTTFSPDEYHMGMPIGIDTVDLAYSVLIPRGEWCIHSLSESQKAYLLRADRKLPKLLVCGIQHYYTTTKNETIINRNGIRYTKRRNNLKETWFVECGFYDTKVIY